MHRGFIVLHRKILDWQWYDDNPTLKLFVHLLLSANHVAKKWRKIDVGRGQLITSTENLAKACCLSPQRTRTAINKLKSTGEITSRATNRFTLITVINYDSYQDKELIATSKATGELTNKQQTNNKQTTTTKQCNNENNENNIVNTGTKRKKEKTEVDEEFLSKMRECYPSINIAEELNKAKAWIISNPHRRFNRRFFNGWLSRSKPGGQPEKFDAMEWLKNLPEGKENGNGSDN